MGGGEGSAHTSQYVIYGTQGVAYHYPFSCEAAQAVTTRVMSHKLKQSPLSGASGGKNIYLAAWRWGSHRAPS